MIKMKQYTHKFGGDYRPFEYHSLRKIYREEARIYDGDYYISEYFEIKISDYDFQISKNDIEILKKLRFIYDSSKSGYERYRIEEIKILADDDYHVILLKINGKLKKEICGFKYISLKSGIITNSKVNDPLEIIDVDIEKNNIYLKPYSMEVYEWKIKEHKRKSEENYRFSQSVKAYKEKFGHDLYHENGKRVKKIVHEINRRPWASNKIELFNKNKGDKK